MQTAGISAAVDGSHIPVLPCLHLSGVSLHAGARGAGIGDHTGDGGLFVYIHHDPDGRVPVQDAAGRAGERHELRDDHRDPEDQTGGRGEESICPMGQTLRQGGGVLL